VYSAFIPDTRNRSSDTSRYTFMLPLFNTHHRFVVESKFTTDRERLFGTSSRQNSSATEKRTSHFKLLCPTIDGYNIARWKMGFMKLDEIELPAAFDAHVHLRDGEMSQLVTPTVRIGGVNQVYVMVGSIYRHFSSTFELDVPAFLHCLFWSRRIYFSFLS
jgi:hypothetical protein